MSWFHAATIEAATQADPAEAADVVVFAMDEDAFRGFYDRTSRVLLAYLVRLTGNRSAADDLLQETYFRFLRAGASLENDTHRRRYLYRIATNLARDRFRRSLARPVEAPTLDLDRTASREPTEQASVEARLDLSRAFDQLRPRDRAMLWLAYAQGASHREIADVVGVGHTSVKPLLFRARRKLSLLLGRAAGPEGSSR